MSERVIVESASHRALLDACELRTYADIMALADRDDPIATSRSGRTFRVALPHGSGSVDCYLKIHDYSFWRRSRWRREKGAIEAANYALLRDRCGVNVPEVVAHGARTRGIRYRDGFILTAAIDASESLDAYALASDGRVDQRLLRESALLVQRMHAASYFHVDLQWRNILVVGRSAGEGIATDSSTDRIHLYLLDSPRGGIRSSAAGRMHGRIRDLSSLYKDARRWLTPRAQLRWLKCYLGRARLTSIDRGMIRTILRDRAIKDFKPTA